MQMKAPYTHKSTKKFPTANSLKQKHLCVND